MSITDLARAKQGSESGERDSQLAEALLAPLPIKLARAALKKELPELLKEHEGEWVVYNLKGERFPDLYKTWKEACDACREANPVDKELQKGNVPIVPVMQVSRDYFNPTALDTYWQ